MIRRSQRSTNFALALALLAPTPAIPTTASPSGEPGSPSLERVRTIALKGPAGGLDHLALDQVDLKAGLLIKQVPGQGGIRGVAYAPDLDRIFAGNGDVGVFNAFDGRDYGLIKGLPLGDDADNVRYNPTTRRIYIVHADKELAVIEAEGYATRSPVALPKSPGAFQLETKRPLMYINAKDEGLVVAIDTRKDEVIARFPVAPAGVNAALAIDEPNHRLFVGCRREPSLVVMDSDTGKVAARVSNPGDVDDLCFDAKRGRIYVSCGEGAIAVIRQTDADRYEAIATIATVGARTSLFDAESGRLFLAVPRRTDRPGQSHPEIWVYQARPCFLKIDPLGWRVDPVIHHRCPPARRAAS